MDRQLIDRLETFVRNEGFTQVEIVRSSTSHTLSGVKDESRLVVHLAEGIALSSRSRAIEDTPSELIVVRPIVPGVTQAITGTPALAGGAGSAARSQISQGDPDRFEETDQ
jgi:hypothetical protein